VEEEAKERGQKRKREGKERRRGEVRKAAKKAVKVTKNGVAIGRPPIVRQCPFCKYKARTMEVRAHIQKKHDEHKWLVGQVKTAA
jgi:hypothetical protein